MQTHVRKPGGGYAAPLYYYYLLDTRQHCHSCCFMQTPAGPKPGGGDAAYPGAPNSAPVGLPPTGNPDPLAPASASKPPQEVHPEKVDEKEAVKGAKKEADPSVVKYDDPANPATAGRTQLVVQMFL